ncbi:MAG: FG-GAP repeat protein [Myxococcales bacterium]|nr:FG-GAP repeat protein [Myxococcales bacterium]
MLRASLRRVLVASAASGLLLGCGDDQTSEASATETGGSSGEGSTDGGSEGPTTTTGETTGGTTSVMTSTSAGPGSGTTTSASGTTTTMTTSGGPNSPPNAVDDHFITWQKQVLSINAVKGLLVNDDDPDGDKVLLVAADGVSKAGGKVETEPLGGFSYTPPPNLWGEDEFSYTIWDQVDGFAEATVRISVNPSSVDLEDVADGLGGFSIDGEATSDYSGNWVDGAGDVDGDGLDDVLVGARFNDAGGQASGSAYVVFGKTNGAQVSLFSLEDSHDGFAMRGEGPDHQAGICVAGAGDVDGDGLADVLVGAHQADGQGLLAGRGYVVFGKTESEPFPLTSATLDLGGFIIDSADKLDFAGRAISSAGDVNGDGLRDLLIGAYGASPQGTFSGSSYVILGGTTTSVFLGKINEFGYPIDGEAQLDFSGHALDGGGDVDGDGLDDIIIGAYGADPGAIDAAGRAYVVLGREEAAPVLLSEVAAGVGGFALDGQVKDDHAGAAVAILGDVNGDGFADVAVGAPLADFSGNASGRTYVIFGEAAPKSRSLAEIAAGDGGFVIDGQAFRDYAGFAVDGAGDVNGDGLDDIIIGAYGSDLGGMSAGRAFVIFGKTDTAAVNLGLVGSGKGGLSLIGEAAGDMAGISVARAGDVNGDGFADVIVGAFGSDAKGADAVAPTSSSAATTPTSSPTAAASATRTSWGALAST